MSMGRSLAWLSAIGLGVLVALTALQALAHGSETPDQRLAKIGPAPAITLVDQDGASFSLDDLRGKVVAVSFVFTRCTDVCPIATYKMVGIQNRLAEHFGRDVVFISVTVDPEHDTPEVLSHYAIALGSDLSGWAYLTGAPARIREVARNYGVLYRQNSEGKVEHILLTSLVDRTGTLRVQYMGERFDPDELLHDLRNLIAEDAGQ